MNTKGFKQMLVGEKMPDKDDPKYKERYERDVRAGRKFAKMCRIDKAAAKVQRFADLHKTLFLVIVFGFVGLRHFVRDGTAGGKVETEEYNYSLSIRLRSVFIFFP